MSSITSSGPPSIHSLTHTLRKLQEQRSDVLTPTGFKPHVPMGSPVPLKSHPALQLAVEPPPTPLALPASPVLAASCRGFSRSAAGLPWSTSAQSIGGSPPRPGDSDWTPFCTEYTQRFRAQFSGQERLLNHQRIVLEGQTRDFRLPVVERPGRTLFGQSTAFSNSPRGLRLDDSGASYRDSVTRNGVIWHSSDRFRSA